MGDWPLPLTPALRDDDFIEVSRRGNAKLAREHRAAGAVKQRDGAFGQIPGWRLAPGSVF